jgi:hypothetical protein
VKSERSAPEKEWHARARCTFHTQAWSLLCGEHEMNARWIAAPMLGLLCSCQPPAATCSDGSPLPIADFASLDDADGDDGAYVSPRRDGMGPGLHDLAADATPLATPDLAGKPMINDAVCAACEMQQCRNVDGNDWYGFCFLTMDPITVGPGAGSTFNDLCLKVLQCARKTGCAASDPEACYCGQGVSDVVCLGNPAGPCRAEFEAAAESSHVSDVIDRLSDPSFPVGAAFNLLRYCEVPICGASCSGGVTLFDGGGLPDLASRPDLAAKADLALPPPDLSPPPDLLVVIPCADLDHDGTPDCTETLVRNPRFDADVSSWTAEYGASATWQGAPDAIGGSPSGSIVVGNTNVISATGVSLTGASQCVTASAGTYRLAAQVNLAAGQGAGSAGLAVQLFPSADCSGNAQSAWSSQVTSTTGAWTVLDGSFPVPAGTGSLRVRLATLKPFSAAAFQARFDNVLLEKP